MYRLILYYLLVLLLGAAFLSYLGILHYSVFSILASALFLIVLSWSTNTLFAAAYQAPTNVESVYISALILALILTPAQTPHDYLFLGWAAIFTMASKYLLNIGKKHLFNPVAIAVVITALMIKQSASWWVGTLYMLPFVVIGGFLIVRKIRRFNLVLSFFIVALFTIVGIGLIQGQSVISLLRIALLDSPFFFFAFVMLTEPLTTPPTRTWQILYGALVGFLFAPQIHVGHLYTTPEIALSLGNLFSYGVSPKAKLLLSLEQKIRLTPDTYDFVFSKPPRFSYRPGQYMEWTLAHPRTDDRGNRRYFTLASSPTEDTLRLGIKFNDHSSSFKNNLLSLSSETPIMAGQLAGDFVLPRNRQQKIVFMAGGIGITPFRSMVKYLIDRGEKRDIVLFYANKEASEIVYRDIFDRGRSVGLRPVYVLTDQAKIPPQWPGLSGRITAAVITQEVPDYRERTFYLSGPNAMVTAYREMLRHLGLPSSQVKTDFFPGFA